MKDCSFVPMANEDFELYTSGNSWSLNEFNRISENFSTDALGNFIVAYKEKRRRYNLKIEHRGTSYFIAPINGDCGNMILYPTINVLANLKINNSYSQGDTLRILENNREIYKFSFPLTDTLLDTISKHFGYSQYAQIRTMDTKLKVLLNLSYRVDSGKWRTPSYKVKNQESFINTFERFNGCVGNNVYQVTLEVN